MWPAASRRRRPSSCRPPPSSCPVKGEDDGLRENLAALASLDYPDYELIVVAHSAADIPPGVLPARARRSCWRMATIRTPGRRCRTCRRPCGRRGGRSEVLAFADSDGRPSTGWLRALVAPLAEPGVGASTGYRWFTPEPPTFWTLMRGVWDAVAAGRLGPGDNPFAWGGAMAIRKDVFAEARVARVLEEYGLRRLTRWPRRCTRRGLRSPMRPGRSGAVVRPDDGRGGSSSWMRRQMMITRRYRPRLWWTALVAHVFYCGGMAASIVAAVQGNRLAEWALIAQLSPGMLKGMNRATLAKAALPQCEAWFRRHQWVHAMWVPLATWLWLVVLAVVGVRKDDRVAGQEVFAVTRADDGSSAPKDCYFFTLASVDSAIWR